MSDIVKINYNGKLLKEVKQSSTVTMLTKGKKMKGDVVIESELGDAVLEPTTITESGEYTVEPPSGVNGFSKIDVAVPRLTLTEEDENKVVGLGEDPGTYELREQEPYPDVIVHSGQYDTTMYNSIEVSVPQPELGTKYIDENGGYNAFDEGYDGYSEVTVNVENTYTEEQVGMMVKEVEPEHYELTTPSIGPVPVNALGEYSIYPGDHDKDAFDQIDVLLPAGPLTITSAENQTYTPQEGVAFTEVTVDLPPITDLSATSNGTYLARDYHTEEGEPILGWNMVEVDVPNTYTVEDAGKIVKETGPDTGAYDLVRPNLVEAHITDNGEYYPVDFDPDADGIGVVNVDVAPQLEVLEITSLENKRYNPTETEGFVFVETNFPPIIDKVITENGTSVAEEEGCAGYSSVTVDVEPPHCYPRTITENGHYLASDDGYYGYSDVDVMVENTYTDEQAGMMVKPDSSGVYSLQSPDFITCEITENGEYSPDKFDPDADAIMYVNVNVEPKVQEYYAGELNENGEYSFSAYDIDPGLDGFSRVYFNVAVAQDQPVIETLTPHSRDIYRAETYEVDGWNVVDTTEIENVYTEDQVGYVVNDDLQLVEPNVPLVIAHNEDGLNQLSHVTFQDFGEGEINNTPLEYMTNSVFGMDENGNYFLRQMNGESFFVNQNGEYSVTFEQQVIVRLMFPFEEISIPEMDVDGYPVTLEGTVFDLNTFPNLDCIKFNTGISVPAADENTFAAFMGSMDRVIYFWVPEGMIDRFTESENYPQDTADPMAPGVHYTEFDPYN